MSSQIDVTKPTTGTATTQSVRDNFSNTVSDIEALQGEASILGIASSVSANALTIALKTSAGIDATSTTGIEVSFRNATASTGTRTVISAQAAISVVAPQGATLGFANSATDNIYAYAINNAGTVELAISASLFDEGTLQSTTAISATADSATVLYSTTARTSVGVRLLGRVKITTGATAGDWSQAPTEIHASNNFHNIIGQDVQAFDATIVVDADIGVTVQAHDADTAKTDVAQTFTADQSHGDNVKAKFGSSDDLQIYHDGATSNIVDTGTGNLSIRGSNSVSISDLAGYKFINCVDEGNGGYVLLNHQNNAEKLRTTSTGIDVTGTVTADGLTVDNSTTPTLNNDTHAGEAAFFRSGGVAGSGNVQAVVALGKADGGSTRSGSAIASVQTDTDTDKIGLGFYTSQGSASSQTMVQKMLIDHSGNVGIGTSSPSYPLTVSATGSEVGLIQSTGSSSARLYFDNSISGTLGDTQIRSHNNDLAFNTSGSERIRIDSSGNVGVGTSSPDGTVHVHTASAGSVTAHSEADNLVVEHSTHGGISILTPNSVTGSIFFGDPDDNNVGQIIYNHATDALSILTAGVEQLKIDSSGNVGIGTSSPDNLLHLHNTAGDSFIRLSGGGSLGEAYGGFVRGWGISGSGGNLDLGVIDNNAFRTAINVQAQGNEVRLSTSGSERMRIDSSGNVGIGTSAPTKSLTVGSNDAAAWITSGGANTHLTISANGGSGAVILRTGGTNGDPSTTTERMRIDSAGKVNLPSGKAIVGVDEALNINCAAVGSTDYGLFISGNNTNINAVRFYHAVHGITGSITLGTSSTSYNTSSDYRLKEDFQPITGATDSIKALNPINFAWKADGSRVNGFLAHELQEVIPEAATGTKDAMRDEEYEVTPALGEVFTPAIEGVTAVYETVIVSPAIEAKDAIMSERNVTETVETGSYVNLAGETIIETTEQNVTTEVVETVVQRQDIDGISTEVEVEVTKQVPVTEAYESTPAVVAVAEVTEQKLISESVTAVAEVIHSSGVEKPEDSEHQWRETTAQVMGTRSVPDYQGIDNSKIITITVKALQEVLDRVDELEAKVMALQVV